jgi:hypothetical protein
LHVEGEEDISKVQAIEYSVDVGRFNPDLISEEILRRNFERRRETLK